MPLPSSKSFARRRLATPAMFLAGLVFAGCGESGDSGKIEYSQNFEKPAGATAKAAPAGEAGGVVTRSESRRKDIEESKHEPAAKGRRNK